MSVETTATDSKVAIYDDTSGIPYPVPVWDNDDQANAFIEWASKETEKPFREIPFKEMLPLANRFMREILDDPDADNLVNDLLNPVD